MSTLTLRIRDDLKSKAQGIAKHQHVSLNNYVNALLAAAVAQEEALSFFRDRLRDVDLAALHKRVTAIMRRTRPGKGPTPQELRAAMGERF
jgi:antitoxin component of RelBE/YafQ-DinJ toxin-antitoxin module